MKRLICFLSHFSRYGVKVSLASVVIHKTFSTFSFLGVNNYFLTTYDSVNLFNFYKTKVLLLLLLLIIIIIIIIITIIMIISLNSRIKTQFLFNISNKLFCFSNKLSEITASIINLHLHL